VKRKSTRKKSKRNVKRKSRRKSYKRGKNKRNSKRRKSRSKRAKRSQATKMRKSRMKIWERLTGADDSGLTKSEMASIAVASQAVRTARSEKKRLTAGQWGRRAGTEQFRHENRRAKTREGAQKDYEDGCNNGPVDLSKTVGFWLESNLPEKSVDTIMKREMENMKRERENMKREKIANDQRVFWGSG
jgi:hypothetical protein